MEELEDGEEGCERLASEHSRAVVTHEFTAAVATQTNRVISILPGSTNYYKERKKERQSKGTKVGRRQATPPASVLIILQQSLTELPRLALNSMLLARP